MPLRLVRATWIVVAFATALLLLAAVSASTAAAASSCRAPRIAVATGCVTQATAAKRIDALTRETMRTLGLKATILRVDTGRKTLIARGFGTSMAGVPASPRMHFRIGSMAIPHLVTLLLQLQDRGRLTLDDTLAKFLPNLPDADRVTLRMLADNTSGYADWIQRNPAFNDALLADPFRQWTSDELLRIGLDRGPVCAPGSCFSYAHTNYAVLSKVIEAVTGQPVARLMRERIFRPLRLRATAISRNPAMAEPVLHAYTTERGVYEDSTSWSPSWTIGDGTVMSATVGDVVKTARAVGTGALISRASSRDRFKPTTVGLGPFTRDRYFAQGIIVSSGWALQNPMLNGYTGVMAHLPGRDLSVALVATTTPAAAPDRPYASLLFARLTAYLSPANAVDFPG